MIDTNARQNLREVLLSDCSYAQKWARIDGIISDTHSFCGDNAISIAFVFWETFDPDYPENVKRFLASPGYKSVINRCALFLSSHQEYTQPSFITVLFSKLSILLGVKKHHYNFDTKSTWPFADDFHYHQAIQDMADSTHDG